MTESSALARVLNISRALYAALSKEEVSSAAQMLDLLSAALSHCRNEKQPLAKCMGRLKRGLRSRNREFYLTIKQHFSRLRPTLPYDFEKAARHVPALIYANDMLTAQLIKGDRGRASAMADALKSYPGFLFGEFEALTDAQFYELVFGFYPKLYEEPFMDEMRGIFTEK